MKRREFLGGGLAALGIGALPWKTWAEMAKHPLAGQTLPAWKKGVFRIATLYTGGSEATFLTFPDGRNDPLRQARLRAQTVETDGEHSSNRAIEQLSR